ncbi:hypothetical protein BKA62DRAFT_304345 [Auriculariales sp. MPI-PUGE-AT-0066]|nr:hypothetical protein BKA62DRAFT_304345 [Auriculariales sp. MPI-PUGE-AT-0066]
MIQTSQGKLQLGIKPRNGLTTSILRSMLLISHEPPAQQYQSKLAVSAAVNPIRRCLSMSNVIFSQQPAAQGGHGDQIMQVTQPLSGAYGRGYNIMQFPPPPDSPTLGLPAVTGAPPTPTALARVRQLEQEGERYRRQLNDLEQQIKSLTSPVMMPSVAFQRPSDHARRAARRLELITKPNRIGNRSCAFHATATPYGIPAHSAPDGLMNCGCSVNEALLEESLAKNRVGSMAPHGRLDPELRRSILKLLEDRYDYKDGDLDFDRASLKWREGDDPSSWERKVKFKE